jgi:hypothetical protein
VSAARRWFLFCLAAFLLFTFFLGSLIVFLMLAMDQTPVRDVLGEPNNQARKQIPPDFLEIYREAGAKYGIPWNVLAAIHKRETNFGPTTGPGDPRRKKMISNKGAIGPFQFLPATWKAYGVDGNGDGVADPRNVEDAAHSAARYLRDHGGQTDLEKALWHYNHASWYVEEVLQIADGYLSDTAMLTAEATSPFRWPVPGTGPENISSGFGYRTHPILKIRRFHDGIDSPAPTGKPVFAAAGGTVIFAGQLGGFGNTVILETGDGLELLYGHLSAIGVRQGERVKTGQSLGAVGNTGDSTGPHLHFTVRKNRLPVDPMKFFQSEKR